MRYLLVLMLSLTSLGCAELATVRGATFLLELLDRSTLETEKPPEGSIDTYDVSLAESILGKAIKDNPNFEYYVLFRSDDKGIPDSLISKFSHLRQSVISMEHFLDTLGRGEARWRIGREVMILTHRMWQQGTKHGMAMITSPMNDQGELGASATYLYSATKSENGWETTLDRFEEE